MESGLSLPRRLSCCPVDVPLVGGRVARDVREPWFVEDDSCGVVERGNDPELRRSGGMRHAAPSIYYRAFAEGVAPERAFEATVTVT
jgi:hypothetical protein